MLPKEKAYNKNVCVIRLDRQARQHHHFSLPISRFLRFLLVMSKEHEDDDDGDDQQGKEATDQTDHQVLVDTVV